jgi:hypothetical protein
MMRLFRAFLLLLLIVGGARAEWEVHVNSNEVSSLSPVEGGLIWGSSGGAVVYGDRAGSFAKVVRSEGGLRSNDVTAVAVDAAGRLWLGTDGYGICILGADSTWLFINTQTLALLSDAVLDIDMTGNMVAVGTAGGVTLFEGDRFEKFFNGVDWGHSGCDSALAVSSDSSVLLVGTQCGLQGYDFDLGLWTTVLPEKRIVDIDYDGDSLFWVVSDDSIFTYDGNTLERIPKTLIRFDIMRAIAARDSVVWAVTHRGPALYSPDTGRWVYNRVGIDEDLWDGTAAAIADDGTVYVGTVRGAAVLAGGAWEMLETSGPYGNYIERIALDGKGRPWCTTGFRFGGAPRDANQGIYVYDGGAWLRFDSTVLPSQMSYAIDSSPFDGSVWIGFWDAANGDLLRYDMADTGFTSFDDPMRIGPLESRVISDIHVTDGGEVIFTQYTTETSFGVLYNFGSAVVYYGTYDDPLCVSSPFLLALGAGPPGSYLTGSYNSEPEGSPPEIAEFHPGLSWSSRADDECTAWGPLSGWPQGHVYALTTDPYGVIWCGTSGGLGSYDNRWHSVRTTIGVVWDIAVDANGTKWIACDRGLYELQGEGAIWSDFDGRRNLYDETNSLLPDRAIKAVAVAADGSLWIGTAGGGIYNFVPDEPRAGKRLSAWVQPYPSPYDEWKGDYDEPVRFQGCKPGAKIKIYTLDGAFVTEIDADAAWDITNAEGKKVVSGVYVFHTYAEDGSEFLGRIVVIR